MKRPQDKNWLDGAIAQTVPGKPPQADFQAWSKQNPQALAFLQERAIDEAESQTESSVVMQLGRRIMRSPITKIAVAAVVIVGVLVLALQLMGQDTIPPSPEEHIVQESVAPLPQPTQAPETTQVEPINELELARSLFEQRDQPGLLTLLEIEDEDTRIAVAGYLGEIGDDFAIPALQKLADAWQGPVSENPYRQAIDRIKARSQRPEPVSESVQPRTVETATVEAIRDANFPTYVSGRVVDRTTLMPIAGAEVICRDSETRTDGSGIFRLGISSPHASAYVDYVDIRAAGYASQRIALNVKKGIVHEDVSVALGLGFKAVGTVRDQAGKPVPNTKIGIFNFRSPPILTDPNGMFEIDGLDPAKLSFSLIATHPSFPYTSVNLPSVAAGETAYLDVTMEQGATVSGQVLDAYGIPIEGTTVGTTMSGCQANCVEDKTDPNGTYRLANVEYGELVLWVSGQHHAPYVWFGELSPDEDARRIDIQIPKSRNLSGTVVDQAGLPLEGVSIYMRKYQGVDCLGCARVKSDSEGMFVIENAPTEGDLQLSVYGDGVSGHHHTVDFTEDDHIVTVQRSGGIYGQVIDDVSNQPITEFTVNLSFSVLGRTVGGIDGSWLREGHRFDSTEGIFDTSVPSLPVDGQYQMTVAADGYDRLTLDPVTAVLETNDPERVQFRLRPATTLFGRITDPNGVPLPAANVHLLSDMNSRRRNRWQTTTSGQAGQFLFPMTGSEPQCLYITTPSYTSYLAAVVDITTGEAGSLVVVMEPSQRVYGRVTDESGRGIPNARLFASVDMPWISDSFRSAAFRPDIRAETDAEGFYELSDLPLGRILLQALTNDGKYNVGREVELFAGKDLEVNFDPREPPSE